MISNYGPIEDSPLGPIEVTQSVEELLHIAIEQNQQILEHIAGIEQAFREVANSTTQAMGFLDDSALGKMLAKFMGRGDGNSQFNSGS